MELTEVLRTKGLGEAKVFIDAQKKKLTTEVEQLRLQLQQKEAELLVLDGNLRAAVQAALKEAGIDLAPPAEHKAKGERKQRMTKEQKQAYMDSIVQTVVAAGKKGIAKGDIEKKLGLEPKSILWGDINKLKEAKLIVMKGEKSDARYFAVAPRK